jgi:hypothetical protein
MLHLQLITCTAGFIVKVIVVEMLLWMGHRLFCPSVILFGIS